MDSGNRIALVVLGMHRSGTSAMARVLSFAGAQLPKHLMPAHPEANPAGFWEPEAIVRLNEEILARNGSAWDDPSAARGLEITVPGEMQRRAILALRQEYGDAPAIVLKDPRISLLMQFWRVALESRGFTPGFVIMVRGAEEVAASLATRDGFSREKGLLLWANYMLEAERGARGLDRVFVRYTDLLHDWRGVLRRIEAGLGFKAQLDDSAVAEIEAYLAPELHRERSPGATGKVAGFPVDELEAAFLRAAGGEVPKALEFNALRDRFGAIVSGHTPDPAGVALAYTLFLGRPPESAEVVRHKAGLPRLAFLTSFLEAGEFRARVVEKVIRGEPLTGGAYDEPPSSELKTWVANYFPLGEPSLVPLSQTCTWGGLYRVIFTDPVFQTLCVFNDPELTSQPFLDGLGGYEDRAPRREALGLTLDRAASERLDDRQFAPADQDDLMGASQFMLLVTLGLREGHRLLDVGCGSLRAGRLLIPYLGRGAYHGVDPNADLIQDGIDAHLGRDISAVKWPHFFSRPVYRADLCGGEFDFILAESILSHTAADLVPTLLQSFARALAPGGLILATVAHSLKSPTPADQESGAVHPEGAAFTPEEFQASFEAAGLAGRSLPWFHPRQTWYALARDPGRLPGREADNLLRGAILDVPAWNESWKT